MKKLEADSAGFKLASHNLHLSEARLRQLALVSLSVLSAHAGGSFA